MPCVVPPMLWSLDELKSSLLDEFPILTTSEGEGYQILFDSFVQWLEITCLLFFRSGEFGDVGAYFHRAYSEINALHGWHRTPRAYSEIIVLGAHTQKSSYSTDGSAYRKNRKEKIEKKKEKKKKQKKRKRTCRVFFFFLFSAKKPWNLIIWNMGEIIVFPAFWAVAHTIAFHEIQVV